MTPQQRRQVEDLYERLAPVPADQHRALLDELCPDDCPVRDEVLTMLRRASSTATPPENLNNLPVDVRADTLIGGTIGPYRILELLGDGGMGSVYKAEQRSPVKRFVALKVIKPGFDTREVIARFDTERQALARMDHPNIAKVLDGGSTDTGRPYFVMEYRGNCDY
jgi:serine/threonine protein kinase